jgi:hypothetical protein
MREEVRKSFDFLFREFGFVFADGADADNETVVVAGSGDMRVRFIRDRADFFVDVGNARVPGVWIGLYEVLDDMKRTGKIADNYKYANKMAALSSALKKNFPAVKEHTQSA